MLMAGRHTKALARAAGAALLLVTAAVAEAQKEGARYTAQQRPRVAVLNFQDTNTEAKKEGYASSAAAMLGTFLQSKSQFVVVEREELDDLYEEKRRIQQGLVDPEGDEAHELLKKTDASILGTVSLLDGTRIEIDAKLLAGFNGEIFATARRSGPKNCLNAIVERLGAALEQDFLRLYHGNGSLEVRLTTPENVRIFLTPIPLDTASPEAQAERSSSVNIGGEYDVVEPWITAPTSYTIRNLLPGWYTLRFARPGYDDLKTDTRRFEVRLRPGQAEVYDRKTGLPLSQMEPELRRFVVHVDSQAPTVVDGDALGFTFRKKGGSLAFRVKRQHLDTDFAHVPRVMLMGGKGLDLNLSEKPGEPGAESQCDLLREQPLSLPGHTLTLVASGQTFDFAAFKGGELIIEDYRGETVPTGRYQLALWDAHYRVERMDVTVRDGDRGKVQSKLARETLPLTLKITGAPPPGHRIILEGQETRYRYEVLLDFTDTKKQHGLPADTYKVSTNIPGLERWKQTFDHFPGNLIPPRYHTRSSAYKPEVTDTYEKKPERPSSRIVKTRFVLAGRTDLLSRRPSSSAADLFIDEEVGEILDLLLQTSARQPGGSDELRQRLEQRLELTDLLLLNPQDMDKLRQAPELAKLVQSYVGKGGALFAFISEPGDYGAVTGAPLVIEAQGKVTTKRLSPKFSPSSWRVMAFTEDRKAPRVLERVERGEKGSGGYAALWLDDPVSFRDRPRRAASRIEEARATVEERVLKWGRFLMYRRYDKSGKLRRQAAEALGL